MSTLSVCLIVKNEADFLNDCISSIQGIADQIVVVDTGSSDNTISIAKSFNAKIEHFKWIDDFSAARNKSLDLATGNWILHIDADETVDANSQQLLLNLINSNEYDAYQLSVRNYHPNTDMVAFQDSDQIRLFRNLPEFRFQNRIHEQIYPSLLQANAKIQNTDILIHHYGYQYDNQQKARRNLPILEATIKENPNDAFSWFKLGETYKALKQPKSALDAFTKALAVPNDQKLDDRTRETLFVRQAQLELQHDNYLESLKSAEKSLNLNSDNPLTLYVASVSALYLTKIPLAQKYLNHLKQVNLNGAIPLDDVNRLLAACQQLNGGGNH